MDQHNIDDITIYNIKIIKHKMSCLIECLECKKLHYKSRYELLQGLQRNKRFFCSSECYHKYYSSKHKVTCANCNVIFIKIPSQIQKSKSGNNFCCKSCAATYNNKHKKFGIRRSKLEIFIEEQIKIKFPDLLFICNTKNIIGSELDFYFPSIKLAIQINGILHFKPIYGQDKLNKIVQLDIEKRQQCLLNKIELFELNCPNDGYLNKNLKKIRWDQIKNVLESILDKVIRIWH